MASKVPTWLITGTSNGIGLALAQHVLKAQHNVISLSRHPEPNSLLSSLAGTSSSSSSSSKPSLYHLQHDLSNTDPTVLKNLVSNFLAKHPNVSVDILVNNAALAAFNPVETIPQSTVEKLMTVNFYSPLWLIQATLPSMRKSQNGIPKVVVNVSSTQGLCCDPAELAYEASKHALEALSGVLAHEIRPFGIRSLVANLGSFRTAFATSGDRAGMAYQGSGSRDAAKDKSEGETGAQTVESNEDPYADPNHPATKRVIMVSKLANMPDAARGDPGKGASILFDGIMCTSGSPADQALGSQRAASQAEGSKVEPLERLLIGSDGLPKIRAQVEGLRMQVESCAEVAALSNADDVK